MEQKDLSYSPTREDWNDINHWYNDDLIEEWNKQDNKMSREHSTNEVNLWLANDYDNYLTIKSSGKWLMSMNDKELKDNLLYNFNYGTYDNKSSIDFDNLDFKEIRREIKCLYYDL